MDVGLCEVGVGAKSGYRIVVYLDACNDADACLVGTSVKASGATEEADRHDVAHRPNPLDEVGMTSIKPSVACAANCVAGA
jgi:hypothetical protein